MHLYFIIKKKTGCKYATRTKNAFVMQPYFVFFLNEFPSHLKAFQYLLGQLKTMSTNWGTQVGYLFGYSKKGC